MGFYAEQILPRAIDKLLRGGEIEVIRRRVATGLTGEVLEVGFGSGRNVPYYPREVAHVQAVDPAVVGRKLAAERVAASPVPIDYVALDGERLPGADASVDHVLVTWTLCTIPDVDAALAEMRRVLRPGGALHFVEHGRSPDPKVARKQDRYTPIQRRMAGGCHLNRPIDTLVEAAGFRLDRLDTFYLKGAKVMGYTFEGVAIRP
jgi:ubiquinone/menaquinone biosynthesis C-methylase UbiE